jgi:hypothetical protein
MKKRYIKPDTTHLPTDKLLPVHVKELPHHGLETCLACKVMKDLRINNFNNIPSNCLALRKDDFWCSLLHLNE